MKLRKSRYLKYAGWGCLFGVLSGLRHLESAAGFIGSVAVSILGFLLYAFISDVVDSKRNK